MLAALAQVYQEHYKDPIQTFVLDFLVHWLGYLLGAECNEVPSYLKGGFTGTVGSNRGRFLQGTVGSCSRFQ